MKRTVIIVEIFAVRMSRRFEMEVDKGICPGELCTCIEKVLNEDGDEGSPDAAQGYIISCRHGRMIPEDATLSDCGIRTGDVLIYVTGVE